LKPSHDDRGDGEVASRPARGARIETAYHHLWLAADAVAPRAGRAD